MNKDEAEIKSDIKGTFIVLVIALVMSIAGFWYTAYIKNKDLTDSTILSMVNYAEYMKKQEFIYTLTTSASVITSIIVVLAILMILISRHLLKLLKNEKTVDNL